MENKLKKLQKTVKNYITKIDELMDQPPSYDRGMGQAKLISELEESLDKSKTNGRKITFVGLDSRN